MQRFALGFYLVLFMAVQLFAGLTLHIQSPWRNDPSKADYFLHILGAAGGGYNPIFGENSPTITKAEGDGWFVYHWEKNVSDFQSWETFKVSLYPNTADQNYNNNNGTPWGTNEFNMGALFGVDTEVWLYTEEGGSAYTKSFVAPGSKIVWFKSPWGNKALPQMIFGLDSILMRFAIDDPDYCGWFYGAITPEMLKNNPLQSARFIRYKTPYLFLPEEGEVELGPILSVLDTVFIDGTVPDLKMELQIGELGACFDSSRVLHVYHPWRTNTSLRDSAFYLSVGNNILNNPTALTQEEFRYWQFYEFSPEVVSNANWSQNGAVLNFYRKQNEWPQKTYFTDAERPLVSQFFPVGIYESWFYPRGNGDYDLLFTPPEPKVIRLLSPWDNQTPSLLVENDTIKMGPFSNDTCGWYQATVYKHVDDWNVLFKQTFGFAYYTATGTQEENGFLGEKIILDSLMALHDTLWIYPYPVSSSAPKISAIYPERLGICPTMKISALVLDWAGEAFNDDIDVDFGGIYGGNAFTTVNYLDSTGTLREAKTCQGTVLGMVQDTLVNGNPARVDSLVYPWGKCSAAREIEKWFVPVEIAQDSYGNSYTNGVCRDIDLHLDEEGFWLADISESHEDGGFFPIDDFEFLDSAKTIRNPKYDWSPQLSTSYNGITKQHNYSFAMKISAQFKYVKGQYFEFRGDDDVWVFINNRLVVDIGGCHNPEEGFVNLDTLGLIEGVEYPFHIFFSERNATGSNFKMRTSINLQTQKTYYPVEQPTTDGTTEYKILQLLMDESISCDISSTQKIDTTEAQSIFILRDINGTLLGENGETLEPGEKYAGIKISENMAGFIIDTNAIVNARSLPSGTYALFFVLAADPSQYSSIYFTVPEYPPSEIAFVNELDETLRDENGKILTERTDSLGAYAFVAYPVRVTLLYRDTIRDSLIVSLNLNTSDSLIFFNKNNEQITEIETDGTGFADFFVMGTDNVSNASFTISGPVANKLTWSQINLIKPPVPFVQTAYMYDRNSDGIPDSLVAPFNEKFTDDIPDTLDWTFGENENHQIASTEKIKTLIQDDSLIVIEDIALLSKIFTGGKDEIYKGTFRYHYTHIDEESGDIVPFDMNATIADKVGPIIENAKVIPRADDISVMTVSFSEGVLYNDEDISTLLEFKRGDSLYTNYIVSRVSRKTVKSQIDIYFKYTETSTLPTVGDSIRLIAGGLKDLAENPAQFGTPWVRISGESRTDVEVPRIITITQESPNFEGPVVRPVAVQTSSKKIEDVIAERGLPGQLVLYDLNELATSLMLASPENVNKDSLLSTIRMDYQINYFSNLGAYIGGAKGSVNCMDSTVFASNDNSPKNCYDNPGYVFFEWNARSENGRLAGTGAYITQFKIKIVQGSEKVGAKDETYTIGIKRE